MKRGPGVLPYLPASSPAPPYEAQVATPLPAYDARPRQFPRASPPKAVMVSQSPSMDSIHAAGFGDGPQTRRESGIWSRMSVMLHSSEKGGINEKSTWLQERKSSSKKWHVIGWTVVLLLLLAIAGTLIWYFRFHHSSTTGSSDYEMPTVPNLGGLNPSYTNTGVPPATTTSSMSAIPTSSSTATRFARVKRVLAQHERRQLQH